MLDTDKNHAQEFFDILRINVFPKEPSRSLSVADSLEYFRGFCKLPKYILNS
jgi:hypothetical protein